MGAEGLGVGGEAGEVGEVYEDGVPVTDDSLRFSCCDSLRPSCRIFIFGRVAEDVAGREVGAVA